MIVQALDVSSRPPYLHDRVSLPVGERAVSQQEEEVRRGFT